MTHPELFHLHDCVKNTILSNVMTVGHIYPVQNWAMLPDHLQRLVGDIAAGQAPALKTGSGGAQCHRNHNFIINIWQATRGEVAQLNAMGGNSLE
jgi:hypothetical protein